MTRRPALPALSGVRGLFCLWVVFIHFVSGSFGGSPQWLRNFMATGISGVDMFFVLSGFTLGYMYLEAHGARYHVWRFFAARAARILPLYFLGMAILLPVWIATFMSRPGATLRSAIPYLATSTVMVQSWLPGFATAINYPAWSVSDEVFFYAMFPVAALLIVRLRQRRSVGLAAALLWSTSIAIAGGYVLLNPDHIGAGWPTHYARWERVVLYNPLVRLPEFLLGVSTAVLFLRRSATEMNARNRALLSICPLVIILATGFFSSWIPFVLLHNALFSGAWAVMIFGLAVGASPLAWFFSRPAFVLLGEASYGIYILQDPLWNVANTTGRFLTGSLGQDPWQWHWQHPAFVVLYPFFLVAMSIGILYVYQEPARRWMVRRLSPAPARRPMTAEASAVVTRPVRSEAEA